MDGPGGLGGLGESGEGAGVEGCPAGREVGSHCWEALVRKKTVICIDQAELSASRHEFGNIMKSRKVNIAGKVFAH